MAVRGKLVRKVCACGQVFWPRESDVKRGWGKNCSKRCKAVAQVKRIGRPDLEGGYREEGWDAHKDGG